MKILWLYFLHQGHLLVHCGGVSGFARFIDILKNNEKQYIRDALCVTRVRPRRVEALFFAGCRVLYKRGSLLSRSHSCWAETSWLKWDYFCCWFLAYWALFLPSARLGRCLSIPSCHGTTWCRFITTSLNMEQRRRMRSRSSRAFFRYWLYHLFSTNYRKS